MFAKLKLLTIFSLLLTFSTISFNAVATEDDSHLPDYPYPHRNQPLPSDNYGDRYEDSYDRYDNRGGCYATFYDKKNFRGRSATMRGNQYFSNAELDDLLGFDPDSVIVGRDANLWLYDGDGFDDLEYYLRGGSQRASADLDGIDSLQMKCI